MKEQLVDSSDDFRRGELIKAQESHREEVQAIDVSLIKFIACFKPANAIVLQTLVDMRFRHTDAIGAIKFHLGYPVHDPVFEDKKMSALEELGLTEGIPVSDIQEIWGGEHGFLAVSKWRQECIVNRRETEIETFRAALSAL